MAQFIASIILIVADYDQGIAFYTQKLGFDLVDDIVIDDEKRWISLAPPGSTEARLVLKQATTPEEIAAVGHQAGGGVLLILRTDNFQADYDKMKAAGVTFLETPREEAYGKVVIFQDPFGHKWDLIGA